MRSELVTRSISQYGCKFDVISETANILEHGKAFIQPMRSLTKFYQKMDYLQSGCVDQNTYLYIGLASLRIDTYPLDTKIVTSEDTYTIQRAQKVCFKDEIMYIWGVLRKCVEEDEQLDA